LQDTALLRTSGHRCKTYCGTAQAAVPASRFVKRGKAGCGRVQASDAALAPFFLPGICSFCSELGDLGQSSRPALKAMLVAAEAACTRHRLCR